MRVVREQRVLLLPAAMWTSRPLIIFIISEDRLSINSVSRKPPKRLDIPSGGKS